MIEKKIRFLSLVEQEGEDYGYNDIVESVDTVIIGRKTNEQVIAMGCDYPHTYKNVYIFTKTAKPSIGNFKWVRNNLRGLSIGVDTANVLIKSEFYF